MELLFLINVRNDVSKFQASSAIKMLQALQLVIVVHKNCLHIVIAQVFTQQSQLGGHNGC